MNSKFGNSARKSPESEPDSTGDEAVQSEQVGQFRRASKLIAADNGKNKISSSFPYKRLFFAFEVQALWPKHYPKGRIIDPLHRHLTIAFLGDVNWKKLEPHLKHVPLPSIKVGILGVFDRLLFLPTRRANVVSYHVEWLEPFDFDHYQKSVVDWLFSIGLPIRLHKGDFLPHVTICRRPFSVKEWESAFKPIPLYISNFHLYESKPGLHYQPVWTYPILPPFDDHNAYGENKKQLILHAKESFSLNAETTHQFHQQGEIFTCPIN